jgi:hypothetical protein
MTSLIFIRREVAILTLRRIESCDLSVFAANSITETPKIDQIMLINIINSLPLNMQHIHLIPICYFNDLM